MLSIGIFSEAVDPHAWRVGFGMMKAWKLLVGIGLAMIALGVAAYLLSGMASVTALIPSFFGILVAGQGLVARSGNRWVVVGAGGWGVLGVAGPTARLGPAIAKGEVQWGIATVSQVVFVLLALALVWLAGWVLLAKPSGSTPQEAAGS